MNTLIKVIQDRRIQMNINFHDIEEATGIPAKRMHSFEKGLTHLSLEEIDRLFAYLKLTHTDLTPAVKKKNRAKHPLLIGIAITILCTIGILYAFALDKPGHNLDDAYPEAEFGASESSSNPLNSVAELNEGKTTATQLRFWATLPYEADDLSSISQNISQLSHADYEVYTIEGLSHGSSIPGWLAGKDKSRTLLNLATRYVWSDGTIKERDRLNKLGYANIGLDYSTEAYAPYVLETPNGRLGILAFSKSILDYYHIALQDQIGLARIHDSSLLQQAITSAKDEVDILIVLIGWGDLDGTVPDDKQQELAQLMVAAGADLIVGNHPLQGQQLEWIEDVPVVYSLGRAIMGLSREDEIANNNKPMYSFVLDVEIQEQSIIALRPHIGRIENGILTFDLSEQAEAQLKDELFPQVEGRLKVK